MESKNPANTFKNLFLKQVPGLWVDFTSLQLVDLQISFERTPGQASDLALLSQLKGLQPQVQGCTQ